MNRAAALAAGLLALVSNTAPARADTVCERFAAGVAVGTVEPDELREISGVAASRRHDGVLWVHDDSDGAPEVVAIGPDGAGLGAYAVTGATARDWEDIAAHDGSLFIGDIGDNRSSWPSVTIYRVLEPDVAPDGTGGSLEAERIDLAYPGGPADAEALLVDPRTGDLVVLTKEDGFSRVLVAPAEALTPGATVAMTEAGTFTVPRAASRAFGLPGSLVTGADVSPDGAVVLVRTYRSILAFTRPDGAPLAAAFDAPPCEVPQVEELQGEAVAFAADGQGYVTIAEGPHQPVHRFEARSPAPSEGPTDGDPAEDDDADSWARYGVAGLVVVVVVVVMTASMRWVSGKTRTH